MGRGIANIENHYSKIILEKKEKIKIVNKATCQIKKESENITSFFLIEYITFK